MVVDSFESMVRHWLTNNKYTYRDYATSYTKLDFTVTLVNGGWLKLEVKEKRQPVNMHNWPTGDISHEDVFILDDLTARKLLLVSPYSGLAVQDRVEDRYFVADVLDLWMMPRTRVNRKVDTGKYKGKWILDFANFVEVDFAGIMPYYEQLMERETLLSRFQKMPDAYGSFDHEVIGAGGQQRTSAHREFDHRVTR